MSATFWNMRRRKKDKVEKPAESVEKKKEEKPLRRKKGEGE